VDPPPPEGIIIIIILVIISLPSIIIITISVIIAFRSTPDDALLSCSRQNSHLSLSDVTRTLVDMIVARSKTGQLTRND
jgi:uncharacterized membrane protein